MRFLVAIFIVLAISFGNLYAFEKNDSTEVNGDILKKNPIAFQFVVGSFLTVTNFNNLNISAKKHFSQKFATRLGLGFNFSDEDLGEPIVGYNNSGRSENNYNNLITTVLDFMYYVSPSDEVKAYGGIGPYFNYYERSNERQSGSYGQYSPYYYYSY